MEQKRSEVMEGPYYVTLNREDGSDLKCEVMASFVTEEDIP